jgi:hypothetical protein
MKTFAGLVLLIAIFSVAIIVHPASTLGDFLAGVKEGDWVEYCICMKGPPLDPIRNLTWYRSEILWVDGASFQVNKTSLTINGTFSSSTWWFNLAEGQTYGWVFIPANLGEGDEFYDCEKEANITIEGEEQKTVLGATRIVTHASDPGKVYKEWDKATGVYIYSLEETDNYVVAFNATATNMWTQTSEQNPSASCQIIVAAMVLTLLVLPLVIFIVQKKLNQHLAILRNILTKVRNNLDTQSFI